MNIIHNSPDQSYEDLQHRITSIDGTSLLRFENANPMNALKHPNDKTAKLSESSRGRHPNAHESFQRCESQVTDKGKASL